MFELLSFLLFTGWSAVREAEGTRRPPGSPPGPGDGISDGDAEAAVLQAQQEFLPYTENRIDEVRHVDPDATSSWKRMAGYTPYLTETVAMYYMLWDPSVPNGVKLSIAAALLYLVSPIDLIPDEAVPLAGWADDAAFLAGAVYNAYDYVTKAHVKQARDWLVDHGVEPTPVFALGKQFDPEPPRQPKQLEQKYGEERNVRPSDRDVNMAMNLAQCIWSSWPRSDGRRPSVSAGHSPSTGQMHLVVETSDPDWYVSRGFPSEMDGVKIYYADRRPTHAS